MKYSEFQPTGFDYKGLGLPNRQDWIVAPVMQTRDSGPLDESNFDTALKILGGEARTVEVHRFNHWGPGWFEIILVHPSREKEVEDIEASLENYPVLDDMDLSEREWEAAYEAWESLSLREKIDVCAKHQLSIFSARSEAIPQGIDASDLVEL